MVKLKFIIIKNNIQNEWLIFDIAMYWKLFVNLYYIIWEALLHVKKNRSKCNRFFNI